MKIYIQDNGVYGMIVVIAISETHARKLMENEHNYRESYEIESHEICSGFCYSNLGDM